MNISVGSGVVIEPGRIDGGGVSNITWCKGSPDLRLLRAPVVGVTDAGAAADADAIGGGADDIGRAPVIVTTAIYSGITGCPVGADSRCRSDGGAMGLSEERLGDPRRGCDGGAMGFAGGWAAILTLILWERVWLAREVDEDRGGGGGWSEVGKRARCGLLVGPGRVGNGGRGGGVCASAN
jgi:hypothetical protein